MTFGSATDAAACGKICCAFHRQIQEAEPSGCSTATAVADVAVRLPVRSPERGLSRAGCRALGLAGQVGDGRFRGDADGLLELGTGSGWFFELLVGQS